MSKTDKDRPAWVRLNDNTYKRRERHRHNDWHGKPLECDIDKPVKGKRQWYDTHCDYAFVDQRHWSEGGVPQWYVDHIYNNPMRREARDTLREAVKDYNANGDTDLEPENRQSRHNAAWYWW